MIPLCYIKSYMDIRSMIKKYIELYESLGLILTHIEKESESGEYHAYDFQINNFHTKFRIAKKTFTKNGQFVTLWKRIENGPIIPFDISDEIDFFVIAVYENENAGHFIFPKEDLCMHGIISCDGIGGKRALRVYAPWHQVESKQAQKTQKWQLQYFYEIKPMLDIAFKEIFLNRK